VTSRITKMITEGLLSTVLIKTLLDIKDEGPLTDTDTADLLLSLSLNAQTKDPRIRKELSRVVYILEEGRTKRNMTYSSPDFKRRLADLPGSGPPYGGPKSFPS